MKNLGNALTQAQALILGVVVIGCSTAATITGHISGTEFLALVGGVGVVGGTVTTAHVVGTQVNTAAGFTVPAGAPSAPVAPLPAPGVTVAPSNIPGTATGI